jgi:hypothetical protein
LIFNKNSYTNKKTTNATIGLRASHCHVSLSLSQKQETFCSHFLLNTEVYTRKLGLDLEVLFSFLQFSFQSLTPFFLFFRLFCILNLLCFRIWCWWLRLCFIFDVRKTKYKTQTQTMKEKQHKP